MMTYNNNIIIIINYWVFQFAVYSLVCVWFVLYIIMFKLNYDLNVIAFSSTDRTVAMAPWMGIMLKV